MFGFALLGLVLCVPLLLVLKNGQGRKRGCGRGCATCGNRQLCHPGQYDAPSKDE